MVRAGASVVLAVPDTEARTARLIYDQHDFRPDGRYRLSDLDRVVRFDACRDRRFNGGRSQFDGGLVVAGPQCVTLDVYVIGERTTRHRRRVAVGAPC